MITLIEVFSNSQWDSSHEALSKIYDQYIIIKILGDFPGGAVVENLPANAGGTGSSPGLGRSHMLQSN